MQWCAEDGGKSRKRSERKLEPSGRDQTIKCRDISSIKTSWIYVYYNQYGAGNNLNCPPCTCVSVFALAEHQLLIM